MTVSSVVRRMWRNRKGVARSRAFCLATDQIVAGKCSRLSCLLTPDGFVSISHNGESLGVHPEERYAGRAEIERVAEVLSFCAERATNSYVSQHICKNGLTVLNALSKQFELDRLDMLSGTLYMSP